MAEEEDGTMTIDELDARSQRIENKLDAILAFIEEARPIMEALKSLADNPMLQAFLPAGMNGG